MANKLNNGWVEAYEGGIATNNDPVLGGIVDKAIASGEWFVIFNSDHIAPIDGLPSREAAFEAHQRAIEATYYLI